MSNQATSKSIAVRENGISGPVSANDISNAAGAASNKSTGAEAPKPSGRSLVNHILASAALTAIAAPAGALGASAATTPVITIDDLASQFRDDAMALDPRIKECWVGYDEIAKGPRDMRVMSVYFGRSDTPFVVPASATATITTLFPEWNEARQDRDEEPATDTEARMSRYQDLQRRITAMRPRSVREAAMQFVVETDDGESEYRETFYRRLRRLAMEG